METMTTKQAAKVIGCAESTVRYMIGKGMLAVVKRRPVMLILSQDVEKVSRRGLCYRRDVSHDLRTSDILQRLDRERRELYKELRSETRTLRHLLMLCGYLEYNTHDMTERLKTYAKNAGVDDGRLDIAVRVAKGEDIGVIANDRGCSRQRIQQITHEVVRKMASFDSMAYDRRLKEAEEEIRRLEAVIDIQKATLHECSRENADTDADRQLMAKYVQASKTLVRDTDLSVRIKNVCIRWGINTIGDLFGYDEHELMRFRCMGRKSMCILREYGDKHGLTIGEFCKYSRHE